MHFLTSSIPAFASWLRAQGIRRFHVVWDPKTQAFTASHAVLAPLADWMNEDTRDAEQHEGCFFQLTRNHDILLGAFVHRTCRGQAAGGTRFWGYDNLEGMFRDGLRLSKGMTHKNALAGLWWGGGKGVVARSPELDLQDPAMRHDVFQEYGELMTAIGGSYITAEDIGTDINDMASIFSKTRFITCIPPWLGGSGNPSAPTAQGVVAGMEAALDFHGMGSLEGKTVAVQGMGHVAEPLMRFLFDKGVKSIVATDIDAELVEQLREQFVNKPFTGRLVDRGDESILAEKCDILAPCATGAILNPRTIPTINAKIVCGASNNQLEDPIRDDNALEARGISYVPDFLTNRMGIVNCANEQYGYIEEDPLFGQQLDQKWEHGVFLSTRRVLEEAQHTEYAPGQVAVRQADELSRIDHPIMGHRGQLIIQTAVKNKWFNEKKD
jgi:glutamate dehydrogenase/leucine dehydrogenase